MTQLPAETAPLAIVDQRAVRLDDAGTEISALRVVSGEIYVPVRALCSALGLDTNGQLQRMRRHQAIAEMLRTLAVPTAGGEQSLVCLELEGLPLWLAGVEAKRVRAELRERLVTYQRWARRRIYEAFIAETGLGGPPDAARTPVRMQQDSMALEHIAQMGLAIATMARQQLAFEQHVDVRLTSLDTQITTLVEGQETVGGRLDQAAAVVGSLLRRVDSIEGMVAPGQVISETQAAEISALVKAIATDMAERASQTGTKGRNPYQAVFGELYRRFRVSSYHNIPARRFADVMAWLREYQETLDAHGDISSA